MMYVCVWEHQVYTYTWGRGKSVEMKQEATGRAMMAALWHHTPSPFFFQITTFKKILSSCHLRLWGIDLLRHSLPFFTVSKCNSLNFLTVFIFLNHLWKKPTLWSIYIYIINTQFWIYHPNAYVMAQIWVTLEHGSLFKGINGWVLSFIWLNKILRIMRKSMAMVNGEMGVSALWCRVVS